MESVSVLSSAQGNGDCCPLVQILIGLEQRYEGSFPGPDLLLVSSGPEKYQVRRKSKRQQMERGVIDAGLTLRTSTIYLRHQK
jgi:hypothetical protein